MNAKLLGLLGCLPLFAALPATAATPAAARPTVIGSFAFTGTLGHFDAVTDGPTGPVVAIVFDVTVDGPGGTTSGTGGGTTSGTTGGGKVTVRCENLRCGQPVFDAAERAWNARGEVAPTHVRVVGVVVVTTADDEPVPVLLARRVVVLEAATP